MTKSHDVIRAAIVKTTARFDARAVRDACCSRAAGPMKADFIRHAYRPFDNRWLYWEADTKLLDEKRATTGCMCSRGICGCLHAQHLRKGKEEPQTLFHTPSWRSALIGARCQLVSQLGLSTMALGR